MQPFDSEKSPFGWEFVAQWRAVRYDFSGYRKQI
jgi:hypothetical protein